MSFRFPRPLVEGLVIARPNRFVMHVLVGNRLARCHCPVTGSIGNIDFNLLNMNAAEDHNFALPCLLSKNTSAKAKTEYTVEALSFDPWESSGEKSWYGINQNRVNRYIEHFLEQQSLGLLTGKASGRNEQVRVEREIQLGNSRIDFCVDGAHYIEVKTPLNSFSPPEHHALHAGRKRVWSVTNMSDRLVRHYTALRDALLESNGELRCSTLLVFMYDAPAFAPSSRRNKEKLVDNKTLTKVEERISEVMSVVQSAKDAGVQSYQVNLQIDSRGVELLKHFKWDN